MGNNMTFDEWYMTLVDLSHKHGQSVGDVDAWREDYDAWKTPENSFYGEFPEHKLENDAVEGAENEAIKGAENDVSETKTHCDECGQSLSYVDRRNGECPCCGEAI